MGHVPDLGPCCDHAMGCWYPVSTFHVAGFVVIHRMDVRASWQNVNFYEDLACMKTFFVFVCMTNCQFEAATEYYLNFINLMYEIISCESQSFIESK